MRKLLLLLLTAGGVILGSIGGSTLERSGSASAIQGGNEARQATGPISGDRVITGVVLNADKEPVAGLAVVAEPRIPWYDKPSRAAMVEAHQLRWLSRRTTTTGADGHFVLDGIAPDVDYVVHVPDLPWRTPGEQLRTAKADAHVAFTQRKDALGQPYALQSYALDLRVGETPVESGQVNTRRGDDTGPHYFVSALRRWNRLQPDFNRRELEEVTLQATAHGVFASEPVVVPKDATAPVRVELSEVTSVHGHFDAPFRVGLRLRSVGETEWQLVSCDDTDSFHLIGIDCGPYLLQAYTGRSEEVLQEWRFDVVPGFQRLQIEYAPRQDYEITLKVVDADGRPVGGVRSVRTACGGRSVGEPLRAIEPGLYTFELSSFIRNAMAEFPDKPLELGISDDQQGKGRVEVPNSAWQGQHEIQLARFGSISIEFENYLGSGFEGLVTAMVTGADFRYHGGFRAPRIPNAVGTGRRNKLVTGDYWVVASYEETPGRGVQYFEKRVSVDGGDAHVRVPLPELHDITMRFPAELHGKEYSVSGGSRFHRKGLVEETVTWNLPAADYDLRVGGERMTFRVPSGGDAFFGATTFQYARIDRTLFADYLKSLGLKTRDLIVAVDGAPFAEVSPMQFIKERMESNGRVRLTIRRGDEFDVTIEAEKCERLPRIVGCLEPISQ